MTLNAISFIFYVSFAYNDRKSVSFSAVIPESDPFWAQISLRYYIPFCEERSIFSRLRSQFPFVQSFWRILKRNFDFYEDISGKKRWKIDLKFFELFDTMKDAIKVWSQLTSDRKRATKERPIHNRIDSALLCVILICIGGTEMSQIGCLLTAIDWRQRLLISGHWQWH